MTKIYKLSIIIAFLFIGALCTPLFFVFANGVNTAIIVPYRSSGYEFVVTPSSLAIKTSPSILSTGAYIPSKGAPAPFGTQSDWCPGYRSIQTYWPVNSNIIITKEFTIPAGYQNVKVYATVDNDIRGIRFNDFFNALDFVHENCPKEDNFSFSIPNQFINTNGTNKVQLLAIDRGYLSYIDLKVTAEYTGKTETSKPPPAPSGSPQDGPKVIDNCTYYYVGGKVSKMECDDGDDDTSKKSTKADDVDCRIRHNVNGKMFCLDQP